MSGSRTLGESGPTKVKVDGEEAVLHITDQSVMFEKGGRVSGFERSAIRMVKPDGDDMIIAYSVGSEVKSARIHPITAAASLVVSGSSLGASQPAATGLNEVFEKLYWNTRKELEERLAEVEAEPNNKNLRLSQEEEDRYSAVSRQMQNLISAKFGLNLRDLETSPISFWGLEKQAYELQLAVVKERHIRFLRMILGPKAERNDITYSTDEVWPEDWSLILERFNLGSGHYTTGAFEGYVDFLKTHWKYKPSERKPVLARP